MNIGKFISDHKKRDEFILTISYYLPEYDAKEWHTVNLKIIRKLSNGQIGSAYDALINKYTEFPLYKDRIVAALKIVAEDYNKNIVDEYITSIGFKACKDDAIDSGINLNAKIEIVVSGIKLPSKQINSSSSNFNFNSAKLFEFGKLITIYHSSHFLKDGVCDKFADKIIYDGKLIFTQDNSDEIDKLRDENNKLKIEVVSMMLIKFLPRDLVCIILSFDPFDYKMRLKAINCWF